ncbi:ras-related protein Rab-30-like [Clytia hemisphaerica]|uniref:Uncharacterized protein n=1 Tax=Clytia hemisphaerica TaxID=252671 RepID=A0A7M5V5Z4_9CNID|eukprot:TCONS_00050365-protein
MNDFQDFGDIQNCYKIMVIGESGVGKSSLIRRLLLGSFSSCTSTTVGVDRKITRFNLGDGEETVQLQLLDAAGSYKFKGILKSYMSSIDAIVFMYDISKKETFACLPMWTNLLNGANTKRNLTKVLVGNKLDLPREVKTKNAVNYGDFEGMIPMETSVKNGESVDLVFKRIVAELKMRKQFPTI